MLITFSFDLAVFIKSKQKNQNPQPQHVPGLNPDVPLAAARALASWLGHGGSHGLVTVTFRGHNETRSLGKVGRGPMLKMALVVDRWELGGRGLS